MNLTALFDEAIERKASDIHLASGDPPRLRIAHDLVKMECEPLDREALSELLGPILPPEAKMRMESGSAVERTLVHRDLAFAGIAYRFGDDGIAATFRVISNQIPSLEKVAGDALDLFDEVAAAGHGLVLIVGPTGSGKWTTACSIVEAINGSKAARIFVAVAHPSYRFSSKASLLTEFHVGVDCESYERALEIAHQSDLDVIALDDLPTADAVRQALIVADAGHLVIANLHAENCIDALERIFASGGPEEVALRRSLAKNLLVLTSQRLLRKKDESGRVLAYEWLRNTAEVGRALVDGDIEEIQRILDTDPECRSLGTALDRLVTAGEVAEEAAAMYR